MKKLIILLGIGFSLSNCSSPHCPCKVTAIREATYMKNNDEKGPLHYVLVQDKNGTYVEFYTGKFHQIGDTIQ